MNNAVKHSSGDINVTMRVEQGICRLEIYNEGHGFPPGFDPAVSANTGLELVMNAARWDLRGEISFDNPPAGGARVTVIFPADLPHANQFTDASFT